MIERLSQRERVAVLVGLAVVLLTGIWLGLVEPYRGALQRVEGRIETRRQQLLQVENLQQRIQLLRQQLATVSKRPGGGKPLFSQVEELTEQTGVKEHLLAMRPQQSSLQGALRQQLVEIKLERLSLEQLVAFLQAVEYGGRGIQVKTLRAKPRFEDRSRLDLNLTLFTLERQP